MKQETAPRHRPAYLNGASHQQLNNPRGLKGGTYGPASKCRRVTGAEKAAIEKKLREAGTIK